jgi:hypothetical protein
MSAPNVVLRAPTAASRIPSAWIDKREFNLEVQQPECRGLSAKVALPLSGGWPAGPEGQLFYNWFRGASFFLPTLAAFCCQSKGR